eukprot:scaffold249913_cov16-Tisochrysis_lutea.AAC.1
MSGEGLQILLWYSHAELVCNLMLSTGTSTIPEEFVLHPQPLSYNYDEFERLLLGIAHHIYITKKKGEAFEESVKARGGHREAQLLEGAHQSV